MILIQRDRRGPGAWLVIALWASLLSLGAPGAAQAQPGGRLESAAEHRAAVRAEAYAGVAYAFASWQDAWNGGDVAALNRFYHDDAVARLPGQEFVAGRQRLVEALPEVLSAGRRLLLTDLDFDSDGATASVVSRWWFEEGSQAGILTSVLVLTRNGWRFRVQVFGDAVEPRSTDPAGSAR